MDSQNKNNTAQPGGNRPSGGGGNNRRRRHRGPGGGQGQNRPPQENRPLGQSGQQRPSQGAPRPQGQGQGPRPLGQGQRPPQGPQSAARAENRNRTHQGSSRRRSGRVLTTNQVLVKYDNLLEQHLITRRKYYEYFNRVDDRQLRRLEKNFFDSIEHLRRFESNLEPWQREALEKRRTERYRLDLTYSNNRGWDPEEIRKADFQPDENEDPHFKDSQKEAFEAYKEDTEESEGSFEDYLKYKGQA